MAEQKISQMIAQSQRDAMKNTLLSRASKDAMPWLAAGNILEALNVLRGYALNVDRIIAQDRLYAEADTNTNTNTDGGPT